MMWKRKSDRPDNTNTRTQGRIGGNWSCSAQIFISLFTLYEAWWLHKALTQEKRCCTTHTISKIKARIDYTRVGSEKYTALEPFAEGFGGAHLTASANERASDSWIERASERPLSRSILLNFGVERATPRTLNLPKKKKRNRSREIAPPKNKERARTLPKIGARSMSLATLIAFVPNIVLYHACCQIGWSDFGLFF